MESHQRLSLWRQAVMTTVAPFPSANEVASRAYERYLQRGQSTGSDLEDWLQAERELLDESLVRR